MTTSLHPDADDELQAAAQGYEDRVAGLGERFLAEAVDALVEIENHPRRFARTKYRTAREVRRRNAPPLSLLHDLRSNGQHLHHHCRCPHGTKTWILAGSIVVDALDVTPPPAPT